MYIYEITDPLPLCIYCSAGGQSYTLGASDMEKAHSWIRKLQDKREQWIRRDAAQGKTDLDRQAKKKLLQPIHERPGVVLSDPGQSRRLQSSCN